MNEKESATDPRPCFSSCEKCGGVDIYRRHRRKGDRWNKLLGDYHQLETVHVVYDTFVCEAQRECLTHHCRTCGYEWTTDTFQGGRL